MDAKKCDDKVKELLCVEKTYKVLKSDPYVKYNKRSLMTILTSLRYDSKSTQIQYNHLRPSSEVIPRLNAIPKYTSPIIYFVRLLITPVAFKNLASVSREQNN